MSIEHDPLLAGMIWRALALLIFGVVWLTLRNEDADHSAFGEALVNLRFFPDEEQAVDSTRTFSRWATLICFLLVVLQVGRYVDRAYPNLIFNRTATITAEEQPKLSKRKGASVSGVIKPGATAPTDPDAKAAPSAKRGRGEEPNENN